MSCWEKKIKKKIIIKKKIRLRLFVKGGALQFGIRAVCSEDLGLDLSIEIKHERAIGIQKYF